MAQRKPSVIILTIFMLLSQLPFTAFGDQQCIPPSVRGGKIFLPVYSQISHGDNLRPFNLAVTVSLRNPDAANAMKIETAAYYDEKGKLVRELVASPLTLMPLHAFEYKVKESDVAGGSGGSIVIRWSSEQAAAPLLAESIMIGTSSAQGISYSSRGKITSFEP